MLMNLKRIFITILQLSVTIAIHAQTMEWLCKPGTYTEIQYMGHDMFKVKNENGKWGILSAQGKTVIKTEYDSITPFSENRALILQGRKNRIIYIINPQGETIQHFESQNVYATSYPYYKEGFLPFKDEKGLYGYLNIQGTVSINAKFSLSAPFQDGVATVLYRDGYFGLITQSGGSAIIDNTKYRFLSSPVNGFVLAQNENRRGDLLRVMQLNGNKLKSVRKLESGMFVNISNDSTFLNSQNGHHYFIDEQWRITGANYQWEMPYEIKERTSLVIESTELLSKQYQNDGIQLTYKGNPIMEKKFQNVETYEKQYAIVKNENNHPGILRLNPQASIELSASKEPFVFLHNPLFPREPEPSSKQELDLRRYSSIDVNIKNIDISDLECYINNYGLLSYAPVIQEKDSYRLYLPYFQTDSLLHHSIEKELDIAITYDGMDWMHKHIIVSSRHEEGFQVIMSDKTSINSNGTASFDIIIQPKGDYFHAPIRVVINQKEYILKNGENKITLSEKVAKGETKTFHYNISVQEEGCPPMEYKRSKTIQGPKKKITWS